MVNFLDCWKTAKCKTFLPKACHANSMMHLCIKFVYVYNQLYQFGTREHAQ